LAPRLAVGLLDRFAPVAAMQRLRSLACGRGVPRFNDIVIFEAVFEELCGRPVPEVQLTLS
jgi:hypothetical protein